MSSRHVFPAPCAGLLLASALALASPASPAQTPVTRINDPTLAGAAGDGAERWPDIATLADGSSWAVWVSGADYSLRAKRLGPTGEVMVAEFDVVPGLKDPNLRPAVAADADGNMVVVYNGQQSVIEARRFAADGRARSELALDVDGDGICAGSPFPDVAMTDAGEFVVTWSVDLCDYAVDGSEVYFRRYDADGNPYSGRQIIPTRSGNQYGPRIAIDVAGRFVIAWNEISARVSDGRSDVYAQAFAATGAALYGEVAVFTDLQHQYVSSVALSYDGADRVSATVAGFQQTDYDIGLAEQQVLMATLSARSSGTTVQRVAFGDPATGDKYPAAARRDGSTLSTLAWLQIVPNGPRRLLQQDLDGVTPQGSATVLIDDPYMNLYTPLLGQHPATGARLPGWTGAGNADDPHALLGAFGAATAPGVCSSRYSLPAAVDIEEGQGKAISVTRSNALKAEKVVVYSVPGTARDQARDGGVAQTDYERVVATLDFPAGVSSRDLSLKTLDDAVDERDELFSLRLRRSCRESTSSGRSRVRILDNEPYPVLTLSIKPTSVTESGTAIPLVLLETDRLSDRVLSVSIRYSGTATKGSGEGNGDYYTVTHERRDTALTIAPGQTTSDSIGLLVNPDSLAEGSETIVVETVLSTNGFSYNDPITVTIRD